MFSADEEDHAAHEDPAAHFANVCSNILCTCVYIVIITINLYILLIMKLN